MKYLSILLAVMIVLNGCTPKTPPQTTDEGTDQEKPQTEDMVTDDAMDEKKDDDMIEIPKTGGQDSIDGEMDDDLIEREKPMDPEASPTAVQIEMTGKNFAFSEKEIRVKKGETVSVTFTVESGTHDWVIDEFNTRTRVMNTGQSETVKFIADTTGTFEYYCSVGTHRKMGMVGKLIVE